MPGRASRSSAPSRRGFPRDEWLSLHFGVAALQGNLFGLHAATSPCQAGSPLSQRWTDGAGPASLSLLYSFLHGKRCRGTPVRASPSVHEASEGSSARSPRGFATAGSRVHSCELPRRLASLHFCMPSVRPAAALPRAAPPAHPVLPGERAAGTQRQAGSFRSLNPGPGAAATTSRCGALPAAARLSPVFSPAASFVGVPRAPPPPGEYAPCSPRCSRQTGTDVGFSSARC